MRIMKWVKKSKNRMGTMLEEIRNSKAAEVKYKIFQFQMKSFLDSSPLDSILEIFWMFLRGLSVSQIH